MASLRGPGAPPGRPGSNSPSSPRVPSGAAPPAPAQRECPGTRPSQEAGYLWQPKMAKTDKKSGKKIWKTGKKIWEKGWTKGMASNFTKNQRAEAMKVGILAIKIALNQPFDQDILVIWHV